MSKQKVKNKDDCQDKSTNSENTIEAGMPHDSQGHETNEINRQMNTQTKAYMETIIQSSATSTMENMQQYMDQQLEVQKEWSLRCIEMINQCFAQLEQTNLIGNGSNTNQPQDNEPLTRQNFETSRTHTMHTTGTDYNTEQGEGNYLSTLVINSLIKKSIQKILCHERQS
ncbi:6735_t:CDS:1 [Cetraspora pellucida]|uniref:6735_t:CDS:1 n=1 Tax=Cetraspora pellucida TaxID=1433469 RepID=A0ACA9M663_9GLOM|nr:6735_t:CDS:1 [Cetraspora pellucida]